MPVFTKLIFRGCIYLFLDVLCRGTWRCSVLPAVRCVAYCPELGGTSKLQFVQILRL